MSADRDYRDIPGTYVLDGEHSRRGYPLNQLCMSLNDPDNRVTFAADEEAYMETYGLSEEQRRAVRERDWLGLLRAGGNIYFTFKMAAHDGLSMQDVGAQMAGMTVEDFRAALLAGGRKDVDG